ncbi:YbaN family protein [Methanobrevibacter curvatus]|uniref:Inner membrane protein YbaN n=1 Tax=Methanobrevibacter curvatus TaxID=49547 RepID=A0A162FI76_9EURY|nr:YbaN family protein [Methanobrevibacter curvatus]KZX10350.1 inner membrane protein YbaN [Methanobrevibacter curvatus]
MKIKKLFYFSFGTIFLSIGTVGIFVPVLPSTPFVIVAALFYGKSSERAEKWIMRNKYFASYIKNYKEKIGIPKDVKIKSLVFLWFMLILSMIFTNKLMITIVLIVIGILVSLHIYLLKTRIEE